jgi:uncharacterized protein YndB with AHSA1/START domain
MDKPTFVYVTSIATTPEKPWEALTRAEFTKQYWFGVCFETDWRVGSKFTTRLDDGMLCDSGEVLEYGRLLGIGFVSKGVACSRAGIAS